MYKATTILSIRALFFYSVFCLGIFSCNFLYGQSPSYAVVEDSARAMLFSGQDYFQEYDFYAALNQFKQAESYLQKYASAEFYVWPYVHSGMGDTHNALHEFELAQVHYRKALEQFKDLEGNNAEQLADGYKKYASVLVSLGDTIEGLNMYRKSLKTFETRGAINDLGQTFQELGMYDSALHYQRILLNSFTGNHASNHGVYFNNLGLTMRHLGQGDEALRLYDSALVYVGDDIGRKTIYLSNKGFVQFKQKANYEAALAFFQEALALLIPTYQKDQVFENPPLDSLSSYRGLIVLKGRATSLFRLGLNSNDQRYLNAALETFQLAHLLIKKIRQSLMSERDKAALGKHTPAIYEEGIAAAYQLFDLTQESMYLQVAFDFIQASKSTSLFEKQVDRYVKDIISLPQAIRQEEAMLQKDLYKVQRELLTHRDSLALQTQEFGLQRSVRNFREEIQHNYPDYFALRYGVEIPKISSIQNMLQGPSQAILEYFVGDTSLYILYLDKKKTRMFRLSQSETSLSEQVLNYRKGLMKEPDSPDEWVALGRALYQKLLGPVEFLIKDKELILMPDGALHHLPFEALLTEEPQHLSIHQLPYWIHRENPISYAHSSSLLYVEKMQREIPKLDLGNMLAVVPEFKQLTQLHTTRQEMKKLSDTYGAELLQGKAATKSSFMDMAKPYSMLLLGTHGILDDKYPTRSRFAFWSNEDKEDGSLYTSDIYGMELNANLAILMACESGLGRLQKGEGSISLGRAFSVAGCPSVVMSLWTTEEAANNFIIGKFLENLGEGMTKRKALFEAKKSVFSKEYFHKGYADPANWSALVLVGEGESRIDDRDAKRYVYFVLMVLLSLLGVWWWRIKRT